MTTVWRIALFAVLILLGCTRRSPSPESTAPLRIGEFSSLTGSESSFGVSSHRGIELAIAEANRKGGVLGRKLELITRDNKGQLDTTRQVVESLITLERVVAVIGEVASDRTLEGARVAQKHGIPLITPNSTNPQVTQVGPFVFRVCYTDPFQGYVMAKFARETLKLKTVAVLKDRLSEYSRGLSEFFVTTFLKMGGHVLHEETYEAGETDFTRPLTAIKEQNPEALFLPGYYADVSQIARQARALGIKAVFLGGDGWDSPKIYEVAREAIAGSYFSNHFTAEVQSPRAREFIGRFREAYGIIPDGVAAQAYDATKILLQAIRFAGTTDPEKVRESLALTRDFDGVTGRISINESRNAVKPAVVLKVMKDSFKYVTTVNP